MKLSIKKIFLFGTFCATIIYSEPTQFAFMTEEFIESITALHQGAPDYAWSDQFKALCMRINEGKLTAQSDDLEYVVHECLTALGDNQTHEILRKIITGLKNYKHVLQSGAAHVTKEELSAPTDMVLYRKKCKTFNRLVVRCLLNALGDVTVGGILTANDVLITGNGTIDGSLTVGNLVSVGGTSGGPITGSSLSLSGNATIAGAVEAGSLTVNGVPLTGAVLGYGTITHTGAETVADTASVTFNAFGPALNTIPGATGITIDETGVYEYNFQIRGQTNPTLTSPLQFQLIEQISGLPVTGTLFASDVQANPATTSYVVNGSGIVSLTSGDIIGLQNITGGTSVALSATPATAINATLTLVRLS